jgi:hypothetical protein
MCYAEETLIKLLELKEDMLDEVHFLNTKVQRKI